MARELMSSEEKKHWLRAKELFLSRRKKGIRESFQESRELLGRYEEAFSKIKDPNDQLSPENYDVDKAAKRLNDYEKELLERHLGYRESYFQWVESTKGIEGVELRTKLGRVEKFSDSEHLEAYATLLRKNLFDRKGEEGNRYEASWRGEKVFARAKELEKFEVEELENIKGIGSFYDFSSVL